jgi:hypothetical protein
LKILKMRGITGAAIAAVVVGVAAQPHNHGHNHQHLHRRLKEQSELDKRDTLVVTEVVEGPTVTEYVMGGKKIDEKKAKDGIDKGIFVVMGTSTPSFSAPPPAVSTSTSVPKGGQFIEQKSSSTPEPSSSTAAAKPTAASVPDGPTGLDADFPSGKVPCSKLPTDYGAVAVPWAADGGWTTLMAVGKWVKGLSFDNIAQPKGTGCTAGCMCSYACPAGYQKTQWPETEQGATGQSVGGLYCNSDGFLELTRPSHTKLCEKGAGGVFVRNELSKNAAICRTDYPGNEAMTIPLDTQPGNTYPLTNPVSSSYYKWQGKSTTAQYYANNEGVSVEQACVWDSSEFPGEAGNWAPTNIGVGKDDSGITYLSIFQNLPTSNAVLNYNIEIEGDYSGECWYRNGQYAKPNGCTIGIKEGGSATLVFKH